MRSHRIGGDLCFAALGAHGRVEPRSARVAPGFGPQLRASDPARSVQPYWLTPGTLGRGPLPTDASLPPSVRQPAERALLGRARLEYSPGEAIQRGMTGEVVHATRTSLRRRRAVLRTFPESFPVPGPADDDLRFVARALSDVRDTDVLSQALLGEADALPETLVPGPARQRRARRRAAPLRRAVG